MSKKRKKSSGFGARVRTIQEFLEEKEKFDYYDQLYAFFEAKEFNPRTYEISEDDYDAYREEFRQSNGF